MWYLLISGGEFIGNFIVYSAPTREEVEHYRDTLMRPQGYPRGTWSTSVDIVSEACWYAYWPDTLRRYRAAQALLTTSES